MAKGKSWFALKAKAAGVADIRIFNDIGDFGITAMDFANELDDVGAVSRLNIAISSNGGDVSQGTAIFNILNRHKAFKSVTIEGLAASMASVIAMAGDEVIMPSNSMLMIHNPWGALMGEADQIKSFGEALETMQDNIADAYVARTGLDKTEVLNMMARETWLSAKKAVELGFADTVESALQVAAAFDVSSFRHVPKKFADANNRRSQTMSKSRNAAPPPESDDEDGNADNVKTAAEMRKEVLAQNREVRSLCNLAGKPNLADGFIEKDSTISEVIAALDKAKTAPKSKDGKDGAEIDTHNNGTGDNERAVATIDPREIFARWNKAAPAKR